MPARPMPDIVVLLPGITGSVLQKDGKDIWAVEPGSVLRALLSFGHSITDLELHDDTVDDGVTAPRVVPDLHLIPGLWKIDGYSTVAQYLRRTFDLQPGRNYFEFPYDWRRDNRIAARRLKDQSNRWLHAWRQESPDAKLILLGHSMGGLVARYFLECLEGWRDTRRLVTFGTPYRGSMNALDFIVHGMRHGFGPVTLIDLSKLLQSFTSVYQLLPIYPCFDRGDGTALAHLTDVDGIAKLDPARVKAADGFFREMEQAVTRNLDDDGYRQGRYEIHPIVGTFQPTGQSARRSGDGVEILKRYGGEDRDGDGTVPRDSATPIETAHEEGAMFASGRHASLQNLDPSLAQVAGVLTEHDTTAFRALPLTALSLAIEDAYPVGQPVPVEVRPEDPSAELRAVITDAAQDREVAAVALARSFDEWHRAEVPPLPAGDYRLTVDGGANVQPVTDVFVVFDEGSEGAA